MEIFVSNIPYDAKSRTVAGNITSAVKRAFGNNVAFKWHRFKTKNGCGSLTLPTIEMGAQFLTHYRGGLPIRDRRGGYRAVRFSPSNKTANPRLVEGLKKQMEEMRQRQTDWDDDRDGTTPGIAFLKMVLTVSLAI